MRQRHVATSWSCKTGSHVLRGELRRRPARGETHVLTFSLEGLAYHTDAWVVRLYFRVLGDCLMRRIDVLFVCVGFHVARIYEFGCLDLSKTFPVRL